MPEATKFSSVDLKTLSPEGLQRFEEQITAEINRKQDLLSAKETAIVKADTTLDEKSLEIEKIDGAIKEKRDEHEQFIAGATEKAHDVIAKAEEVNIAQNVREKELTERSDGLDAREGEIKVREDDLLRNIENEKIIKKENSDILKKIEEQMTESEKAAKHADVEIEKMKVLERRLSDKDASLAIREKDVKDQWARINEAKLSVEDRERKVNAQEQGLAVRERNVSEGEKKYALKKVALDEQETRIISAQSANKPAPETDPVN